MQMSKQVQFIYLSQAEYDSLPTKSDASLYFISDNRRIYRGQYLFGGMNLDSSTFKVDGKQVSTQGHTHSISEFGIDEIECDTLDANGIRVNGKDVSVEGHRHSVSDIDGLTITSGGASIDIPTRTSQLTNDSGFQTASQVNDIVTQRVNDAIQAALDAYYGG